MKQRNASQFRAVKTLRPNAAFFSLVWRSFGFPKGDIMDDDNNCTTPDDDGAVLFTFLAARGNCIESPQEQEALLWKKLDEQNIADGELLDTMEQRAAFPVAHFVVTRNYDSLKLLNRKSLGSEFELHQGIYKMSKCYRTSIEETKDQTDKAFIFMGYKSLDDNANSVLVKSWKQWTGANIVYTFLPSDFLVSQYTFYERIAPDDRDIFMYILLIECRNVTYKNRMHLMDFVQRLRMERMFGYLTVYRRGFLQREHSFNAEDEDFVCKVDI